jgi:hypothetical protein
LRLADAQPQWAHNPAYRGLHHLHVVTG